MHETSLSFIISGLENLLYGDLFSEIEDHTVLQLGLLNQKIYWSKLFFCFVNKKGLHEILCIINLLILNPNRLRTLSQNGIYIGLHNIIIRVYVITKST